MLRFMCLALMCLFVAGCDVILTDDAPESPDTGPDDPCQRRTCPEGTFCVPAVVGTTCIDEGTPPCDRARCTADSRGITACAGGYVDPRFDYTCADSEVCVDTGEAAGCVAAPPVPCAQDRCADDTTVVRCHRLGYEDQRVSCRADEACAEWEDGAGCASDPPLPCDDLPPIRCGDGQIVRQHCVEGLGLLTSPFVLEACVPEVEACFQGDDTAVCGLSEGVECATPSAEVDFLGGPFPNGILHTVDEPLGCDGDRLLYCGATRLVGVLAECESGCVTETFDGVGWSRCVDQPVSAAD